MNTFTQQEIDEQEKKKYQQLHPDAVFLQEPSEWKKFLTSGEWRITPFRIIDTNPVNKHTALCSCAYCLKIKRFYYANPPEKLRAELRGTILERVLQQDGIWK